MTFVCPISRRGQIDGVTSLVVLARSFQSQFVMAETQNSRAKGKSLGKYCVAGGPGKVSCKNNSKTEGISMHRFRSDSSVPAK
jgi:hypothetical protein